MSIPVSSKTKFCIQIYARIGLKKTISVSFGRYRF